MKTLLKEEWSGQILRETVSHKGKTFKITSGLINGGERSRVYLYTDEGLKQILSHNDLEKPKMKSTTSYVSPESVRLRYARLMIVSFKEAISKLY